jgi:hypothetical protein
MKLAKRNAVPCLIRACWCGDGNDVRRIYQFELNAACCAAMGVRTKNPSSKIGRPVLSNDLRNDRASVLIPNFSYLLVGKRI